MKLSAKEWRQLRLIWFAVAVAGGLSIASPKLAGVWYAAISLYVAVMMPRAGLGLILAGIPLTYNVSPGVVNLSISEVALVFVGTRAVLTGRPKLMPVILPIGLYLFVCVLSSAVDFRGKSAIVSFVQMFVYLIFGLATFSAYGREVRPIIVALIAMVGTSLALAILMILQGGGGYLFGIHKNSIGATTAASTVVAVEMYFRSKTVRDKLWSRRWLLITILLTIGMFLSLSRGAWASAVIAVFVIAFARREWKILLQLAAVTIPLLVIGFLLLDARFQEYILGSVDTSSHSFGTREANAKVAMFYFEQNQVIGSGLGLRKTNDATNVVLFTLAETGLLGLGAFLSIHAVALYSAYKKRMRIDLRSPGFSVVVLSAALLLGRFGHGLVDHYWSRGAITVTWALVGAAMAVPVLARVRQDEQGVLE
jgi:O-antigen ligase